MGRSRNLANIFNPPRSNRQFSEGQKSKGILDDHAERKSIDTKEGSIIKVPVNDNDITNKAYVDSVVGGGAVEGTAVLSTGEAGAVKFLREDGDGTSSWQVPAGAGDMTKAEYDAAAVNEQLVGLTATQEITNKTLDDFSNRIDADEVHIEIRNESGSTLTKGQLVFISGYSVGQNLPLVTLADASSASTMPALAMINDGNIANNAAGHATQEGRVFNIDTSAFTAGDTAYVSTTAGALSTRPSGTNDKVQAIGIILRSHATLGVIQIFGAGRTNDIPNDIDHDTDLLNVGTNTHAQIDTSITATGLNTTARHGVNDANSSSEPVKGADDNYVTDAEKIVIGNTSGTNSGDQTIPTVDDTAYNTTTWNTNTDAATKNAIRDQVEIMITAEDLNTTHRGSNGSEHADVATNTTHRGLTNDPHNVTASQVGLGNVSNVATSDVAYNTTSWNTNTDNATKNAIRDKVETMDTAIGSNTSASHSNATDHASGSDDQDISGIATNASNISTNVTAIGLNTTHRSSDGSDHSIVGTNTTAIGTNTTHRGSDGSDHSAVVTNTAKVSFSKTNVKATINHGGTAGTTRPTGFDSVEWIGTVSPDNATNDDTWIDVT